MEVEDLECVRRESRDGVVLTEHWPKFQFYYICRRLRLSTGNISANKALSGWYTIHSQEEPRENEGKPTDMHSTAWQRGLGFANKGGERIWLRGGASLNPNEDMRVQGDNSSHGHVVMKLRSAEIHSPRKHNKRGNPRLRSATTPYPSFPIQVARVDWSSNIGAAATNDRRRREDCVFGEGVFAHT